jgi:hypothetical protein
MHHRSNSFSGSKRSFETPYLLTSDEAVIAAKAAGDVTVTRAGDADFRCPVVQP